jgi:hypothetical protein
MLKAPRQLQLGAGQAAGRRLMGLLVCVGRGSWNHLRHNHSVQCSASSADQELQTPAAVVTGIQIHNWGQEFDGSEPNLEYVAPVNVYVVVDGKKTYLNLSEMPVCHL